VIYLKDQKETRFNNHLKGLKVTGQLNGLCAMRSNLITRVLRSVNNPQLPNFRFHSVCQYALGQVQFLQRLCLQLKDGRKSFPTKM